MYSRTVIKMTKCETCGTKNNNEADICCFCGSILLNDNTLGNTWKELSSDTKVKSN
jgi:hypothetical protein